MEPNKKNSHPEQTPTETQPGKPPANHTHVQIMNLTAPGPDGTGKFMIHELLIGNLDRTHLQAVQSFINGPPEST